MIYYILYKSNLDRYVDLVKASIAHAKNFSSKAVRGKYME